MKKILTFTFHSAVNYGAVLQAIGLQRFLIDKNYKNRIADYTDECMYFYYPLCFKNLKFIEKIKKLISFFLFDAKTVKRNYKFRRLINKELLLTDKLKSIKQINEKIKEFDILITGSDQVWNFGITKGLSDIYSLNFKNAEIKKISYAASIGNSSIPEKYSNIYKEKLSGINYISVREKTAQTELKKILQTEKIEVVLDPTLLLSMEQWNQKLTSKIEKEKYILAYDVQKDDGYIDIVNKLSSVTGLKIVFFDMKNIGYKNVLRNAYCDDPYEFLNLIKNAEYIVTTSFHATVFSIIFNKKFWVIPHKTTGSRVNNLLELLRISNRAVTSLEEFNKRDYDEEIDYESVNKILESERKKSGEWLINAIEN